MPELPPPPDAPPSSIDAWAWVWSRLAGPDGQVSARRVLGALGAGLAVVVVAVVAWRAFGPGGEGGGGPPPELTMPRAAAGDGSPAQGADSGGEAAPAAGAVVVAHVAGAVVRPGLYRLGGSPRVADALDAAGGPAPDAELDAINLAAAVVDGERVYLPRRGEAPQGAVVGAAGGTTAATGPLDLNAATAAQLEDLPGVGPSTASAILAYRQQHGRFRTVDELLEVRGIGEARLAELRPKVRVR